MLYVTEEVQSLTNFRRKAVQFFNMMKKRKRILNLTVNGKAEAVVQDLESYQRLLDSAGRGDVYEAIRQGVDDVVHGRTRPAREVFDDLRRRHG